MSVNPRNNTTVSVLATGVCLGCLNRGAGAWEVGFIRDDTHNLTVKVIRKTNGGDVVIHPSTDIPPGSRISVSLNNGTPQSPDGGRHRGDFGRIVDIDTDVHPSVAPFRRPPTRQVTELKVSLTSDLYAHADKESRFPLRLTPKNDPNHVLKKLGKIPTTAGTDITFSQGEVVVTIQGPGSPVIPPVPHTPGVRYEVWFDNNCPQVTDSDAFAADAADETGRALTTEKVLPDDTVASVPNHSDFVLYYHVLNVGEEDQRDLNRDEDSRGEGAICNYSHLGTRTSMFPL